MSNELIFILTVLIYLGSVLVLYKVFGKNGLYAFAVFGTLLGNIAVCKCVDIFGLSTTSEKYGKKEASKAVAYSFSIMILWMLGTQLILLFTPNTNDYISESLKVVFGLVPRITIASLIGFVVSQNLDVFLYHFLWSKTGNTKEKLWLRNNGSTLTSQAIDTIIFTTLAFWGVDQCLPEHINNDVSFQSSRCSSGYAVHVPGTADRAADRERIFFGKIPSELILCL